MCEEDLERHSQEIGGIDDSGNPIIVEIDESKFFHRKYHCGVWRPGHWVFGGIERQSGRCFLVEVPDRTAETLEAKIQEYILPSTHIMSDGWASYVNVDKICNGIYTHEVVIHKRNFVDPEDPMIHTQTVEDMWMRTKRKIRQQLGTSEALFPSYIHEFVWRNKYKHHILANLFICISEQYPLS